jgi:hypothetical protein
MKKIAFIMLLAAFTLTSCYSYKSVVGKGPQGNEKITQWNHYVIEGLVPVGVSDSKSMAGNATDYSIHTRHTFINLIIGGITFGIYTPTTTTVTK